MCRKALPRPPLPSPISRHSTCATTATTMSSRSVRSTATWTVTWSPSSATLRWPTAPASATAPRIPPHETEPPMITAPTTSLPRGRQVDFTQLGSPDRWQPEFALPYNQRMIGQKVLITNDFGDWLLLTLGEFRDFVEGQPQPGEPLYERLKAANFIAREVDRHVQAARWRRKKRYLFY